MIFEFFITLIETSDDTTCLTKFENLKKIKLVKKCSIFWVSVFKLIFTILDTHIKETDMPLLLNILESGIGSQQHCIFFSLLDTYLMFLGKS